MTSFYEQSVVVDSLAKEMNPTRNGHTTAKEFMEAVELTFKQHGWNMSAYIEWANGNYYSRQPARAKQVELNDTHTPT